MARSSAAALQAPSPQHGRWQIGAFATGKSQAAPGPQYLQSYCNTVSDNGTESGQRKNEGRLATMCSEVVDVTVTREAYEVIVVGSGAGGLSAAATAAARGARVWGLEATDRVGG